jgi:hypothetical protein
MKLDFSITYSERLESYFEIVKATMPGFFVRWVLFLFIGLIASGLLVNEGLNSGIFGKGYWYILLGILNGIMFSTMTYKNINLKRMYNMQIKDKSEWKYSIEIDDNRILVKTDKSEARYGKVDIEYVKETRKYIFIKTIFGNSIVLPKEKANSENIEKIKQLIDNTEMPNN